MLREKPEKLKILLRVEADRTYFPGEIIEGETLAKWDIKNINGMIWNNQVEVYEEDEPQVQIDPEPPKTQPVRRVTKKKVATKS